MRRAVIKGHGRMKRSINITIATGVKAADPTTPPMDYDRDAARLARILATHLPSGTFDRLLKNMFAMHMRDYLASDSIAEAKF